MNNLLCYISIYIDFAFLLGFVPYIRIHTNY